MPSEVVMSKQARMLDFLAQNLSLARKLLLSVGGIASVLAPIAIGLLIVSAGHAQSQESFDVASVKLNKTGGRGGEPGPAPGGQRVTAANPPLPPPIILGEHRTPPPHSRRAGSLQTESPHNEAQWGHP